MRLLALLELKGQLLEWKKEGGTGSGLKGIKGIAGIGFVGAF